MNRLLFASRLLVVLALAVFWIGCKTPAESEGKDATANPRSDASVAASPVECRAKNADGPIELALTWDKDLATGTLKTTKEGKASTLPVVAQLYKGLILVDAPGTKNITGALATVTTEGKKTIRLGDDKQPFVDCE